MADDSVENESASSQQAKLENQDRPEDDKNSSANENAGASRESDSSATSNRNIKIGSQRDNAKQAEAHVAHGTESVTHVGKASGDAKDHKRLTQSKKPPTIDSVVTPELQKEIDQAIDDSQIEQLLNSPDAIANDALTEGERLEGRVHSVSDEHVLVDLARPHQGILPIKQLKSTPTVGESIAVIVRNFNSTEGIYDLAIPGAVSDVDNWQDLAENMVVDVLVTGHNKGGLEVTTNGLRGFIPASQVALFRINNFEEFIGNKFSCIVTKVEPERKNLILSRRAVLEREREANKEKILAGLEAGQIREGTVIRLQPFGAFVDIGGIDGLVHVSKMSWARINDPSEILTEGQAIKVKVERVNQETGKISLSYRDTFENPWDTADTRYPARSRVKGTVTRLTDFGAFIRLEAGIEGLLHVSEIAHRRVQRPSDILNQDQQLEVQVLAIDPQAQRISLSLKALEVRENDANEESQTSISRSAAEKRSVRKDLKGGTDQKSGGEQFGLKW
ncbi:MAG: S1 RNA-binding domain-containing protein [Planctomycetales bacterium]